MSRAGEDEKTDRNPQAGGHTFGGGEAAKRPGDPRRDGGRQRLCGRAAATPSDQEHEAIRSWRPSSSTRHGRGVETCDGAYDGMHAPRFAPFALPMIRFADVPASFRRPSRARRQESEQHRRAIAGVGDGMQEPTTNAAARPTTNKRARGKCRPGYKWCPSCGEEVKGRQTQLCPACGHSFVFRTNACGRRPIYSASAQAKKLAEDRVDVASDAPLDKGRRIRKPAVPYHQLIGLLEYSRGRVSKAEEERLRATDWEVVQQGCQGCPLRSKDQEPKQQADPVAGPSGGASQWAGVGGGGKGKDDAVATVDLNSMSMEGIMAAVKKSRQELDLDWSLYKPIAVSATALAPKITPSPLFEKPAPKKPARAQNKAGKKGGRLRKNVFTVVPKLKKCGRCKTCLNPNFKKACLTVRAAQIAALGGKAKAKNKIASFYLLPGYQPNE